MSPRQLRNSTPIALGQNRLKEAAMQEILGRQSKSQKTPHSRYPSRGRNLARSPTESDIVKLFVFGQ